jgi:hypothetical protein
MPKNKASEGHAFEYYEAAACGPHVFFARGIEFVAAALRDRGEKVGYHTFLPQAFDDVEAMAKESGGKEASHLTESFPMRGLNFSKARGRLIAIEGSKRDGIYQFNGFTPNPVFVGILNFITNDYGRPSPSTISFMLARSKTEALEFVKKYMQAKRNRTRQRRCILNSTGDPIEDFREMDWGDVFLPGTMLEDIRSEITAFFGGKKMYDDHGLDWRRGILLAGPPGNGKTTICRALATTADVPIVYCAINEGDMFGLLNNASATISQAAPCIAIFEDADALGSDDAVRSALLNMLDGLFTCDGVLTIASTNCPDKLDSAFTGRPSRFDSYYVIPNPAPAEREKILLHRLRSKAEAFDRDELSSFVADMIDISAACVQEIAVCALMASLKSKKPVSIPLLRDGLDKVKAHMRASKDGMDKWLRGSVGFGDAKHDDESKSNTASCP